MGEFYAHTPGENSGWHMLAPHLEQTAEAARRNAEKFGAGELARLAGLWHDVGKFNPEFQEYLRRCEQASRNEGEAPTKGVAPHAVYGAMLAAELVQPLAPVIYGHHAGLPNRAKLQDALKKPELREPYERILPLAREQVGDLNFQGDVWSLIPEPPQDLKQMPLFAEMFSRMVFSALVDADFLDTETHFDPGAAGLRGADLEPADLWEVLRQDQESLISEARYSPTPVNQVREEVYRSCLSAAELPRGVFRLSVPTGGGKTRSGLAFALRHAVEHDLDRVIVTAPYTSIIEQTASTYRRIFGKLGEGAVLEHHSAIRRESSYARGATTENAESAEQLHESFTRSRLATQNWDAPLVVTTTVQLFESLFAKRTSRCRKLHNISRSVIVLDEVQTLPVKLLEPIVSVLKELVRRYGVTVVLCTATQPALDERSRYLEGFESVTEIVPKDQAAGHFQRLRRVEYETHREPWSWDEVAERLLEAFPERRAMVVLNTRKDALALLDRLEGEPVLHLSTLLCGAHRQEVLEEVRRRLKADEPCLLVATQVVEAGVDLDFPVVFRALGPLDRIVQAAGRCNREGKMDEPGRVVVFRPEEGKVPRGEYAAGFQEAGILLEREELDLHDPGIFREYFQRLYQDVPTDREEIQKSRREFDYPEVARKFRLIPEESVPVIVEYDTDDEAKNGERRSLIDRIRYAGIRGGDHRKLQPYVVGMFEHEFKEKMDWMEEMAEGVFLWLGSYDSLRGIPDVSLDPADLIY